MIEMKQMNEGMMNVVTRCAHVLSAVIPEGGGRTAAQCPAVNTPFLFNPVARKGIYNPHA